MKFFEPTDAFIRYLRREFRRHPIIDVGAGEGHVCDRLAREGTSVFGIDLFPPEGASALVHQIDGATFDYPKGSAVLLCRPCHGGFVQASIRKAIASGVSAVLYAGLPGNVAEDLGELHEEFRVVEDLDEVGAEGERLWRLDLAADGTKAEDVVTYCLVGMVDHGFTPYWFEDGGDRWKNGSGGWCGKRRTDKIFEIVTMPVTEADVVKLDWTKTGYMAPDSPYGWLSPDGAFTGCKYKMHALVAFYVLKHDASELEAAGWVKIDYEAMSDPRGFFHDGERHELTAAQKAWLDGRGYDTSKPGSLVDEENDLAAAEAFLAEEDARPAVVFTGSGSSRRKIRRGGD